MKQLKLFSKLKGSDIVNIILIQQNPGTLVYLLMSKTINYTVISRGKCSGNIDKPVVALNVNLSSLFALVDKQMNFNLEVTDGKVNFISESKSENKVVIHPLSIEYASEDFGSIVDSLSKFELAVEEGEARKVDLSNLKKITDIAAKSKKIIQVTPTYAAIELQDGFIFNKLKSEPLAISGLILKSLLIDGGEFHFYDSKLYYTSKDKETFVVLRMYLPSLSSDFSLVTNGKILEKYSFNCNDIARLINYMYSSYPDIVLNMESGKLIMSNDSGERIECGITLTDTKTVALEKLKSGDLTQKVTMTSVRLPSSILSVLPVINGEIDLFVKAHKIIIKQDDLYFVFGR